VAVHEFSFIPPCPFLARAVFAGDGWVHEVEFDGCRVQANKLGSRVVSLSRNGHDLRTAFHQLYKWCYRSGQRCRQAQSDIIVTLTPRMIGYLKGLGATIPIVASTSDPIAQDLKGTSQVWFLTLALR
jgi:hypothetical protein